MRAVLVGMMLAWRAGGLQRSHGAWRAGGLQQRAARSSVAAAPPQNIAAAPPQPIADASEPAFRAWLDESLNDAPRRDVYGGIYDECADAVVRWRRRYHGNPQLWKRLMKERLVKELVECAPVIAATRDFVAEQHERVTIVDLCSGKGYLSMFLSELLPPDRVERCVLVDKAWPHCHAVPKPSHINWDHVYGSHDAPDGTTTSYFDAWPIRLTTSKQNLKCPSTTRGMVRAIFDRAPGPVAVLAVHLCGTLSLRALDLFNSQPATQFLVLKPCCLPPMLHAVRNETFVVGGHAFDAADVASHGKFRGGDWIGPPRRAIQPKFERWAAHLEAGALVRAGGRKSLERSEVQTKGGFQNLYIFAEHDRPSARLWDGLRARGRMPALL